MQATLLLALCLRNDMPVTMLQSCAAHHALHPLIDHAATADVSLKGVHSMPRSRLQMADWRQTRPMLKDGKTCHQSLLD